MIRVLTGSARLESAIRAIPSLEFAGFVDPSRLQGSELAGEVLLIDADDASEQDFSVLAALPIPVVLLGDEPALASSAFRSGIRGVLSQDATSDEIEAAVHAVNAGLAVMMPDARPSGEEPAEPLSTRELEVLDLVAEGLSNKLIAHRLSISEHTVKTHIASIFAKLGAASRTEAVSLAIRRGLVML